MRRLWMPIPSERGLQTMWVIVAIAVAVAVGWLVFTVLHQAEQIERRPTVVDVDCTSSHLTTVTLTFTNGHTLTTECD